MLPLPHQLLLLELDARTGKSVQKDGFAQIYGLAATFAAELQLRDRLVPVAAGKFAISGVGEPLTGALGLAEARLAGRRPLSFDKCVGRVGDRYTKLRRAVLDELVALGALRAEADRLWILTWRTRWPSGDPAVEQDLVAHLRTWLREVRPEDPPGREDLLLSVLRACKLLGSFLSDEEQKAQRERIVERTARAPIGVTVRDLARAAAAAAMTAAIV